MTANHGEPQTSAPPTPQGRQGRIPADTFSNRLLLARALAGHLSIREACERTGLNRGNWQGWERGLRPRDQVEVSHVVAEALDVDFNWLLLGGPLEGPRGRVVAKRPTTDRQPYSPVAVRPSADRPKGRTDSARPISPQIGQPRRANRVNPERTVEVINAA